MNYLSVCSGIEAATTAWHPLGWKPVAFSEIEPFPCAVLAHHYPTVPNKGDMTKYKEWGIEPGSVELLVGGTPCQSFSVAGLRRGLADPRGNLMLTYGAIADHYKPRWLVWENVPGVLSSNGGRDFGTFLGMLGLIGYGFAYRILDAQYAGLAQRRRRVFVVGHLGDWRRAAAVLFESQGLRWDPPPSRESREDAPRVAGTLAANGGGTTRPAGNANELDFCVPVVPRPLGLGPDGETARALNACPTASGRMDVSVDTFVAHTLRGEVFDASEDGTGRGTPIVPIAIQDIRGMDKAQNGKGWTDDGTAYTVDAMATQGVLALNARQDPDVERDLCPPISRKDTGHAIAFSSKDYGADAGEVAPTLRAMGHSGSHANGGGQVAVAVDAYNGLETGEVATTLTTQSGIEGHSGPTLRQGMAVRRLTPRECERLQGFPDSYTMIPWKGKSAEDCPDGPRYKALGNSMAVPVMAWIGRRIKKVEEMAKEERC